MQRVTRSVSLTTAVCNKWDDDGATWTVDREVLRLEGSDVRDPALWVADDG